MGRGETKEEGVRREELGVLGEWIVAVRIIPFSF